MCGAAKLISETFDVLSVTVWLLDEEQERLIVRASTARQSRRVWRQRCAGYSLTRGGRRTSDDVGAVRFGDCKRRAGPKSCGNSIQRLSQRAVTGCVFPCVPENEFSACSCSRIASMAAVYTVEELELLKCIADQMTSVLMNHRLAAEVAQARELEAFRTMSVFFVHDLKNAAASLNLMLQKSARALQRPRIS